MIYDLLPHQVKILYLKMQTAESLAGFLDSLRELLQELEYTKETKKGYEQLRKKLAVQEEQWTKAFMTATKWITNSLEKIKKSKHPCSQKLRKLIKKRESDIANGTPGMFAGETYFEMRFNLLESVVNLCAQYGAQNIIEDLCDQIKETTECISFTDDPLEGMEVYGSVLPDSAVGKILEEKLGYGFMEVKIIHPSDWNPRRQYLIRKGIATLKLPLEIEEYRNQIQGRVSPETRDKRPFLLLHTLYLYAYWRDWMESERKVPENASEKKLMQFYNQMTMIGRLQLDFGLKGGPESTRKGLTTVLDRLLVCVLRESGQSQLKSSERALRYAYSIVKELLMELPVGERNAFTYKEISSKILNGVMLEDLSFPVKESHCLEACRQFAKEYGWVPRRKAAQKKG